MGIASLYFRERDKIFLITRIILTLLTFLGLFMTFNFLKIVSDAFAEVEKVQRLFISMIFYLIFNFGILLIISIALGYGLNIFLHYIAENVFSILYNIERNKKRKKSRT